MYATRTTDRIARKVPDRLAGRTCLMLPVYTSVGCLEGAFVLLFDVLRFAWYFLYVFHLEVVILIRDLFPP